MEGNNTDINDVLDVYVEYGNLENGNGSWTNRTPIITNQIDNFLNNKSVKISLVLAYTLVFSSCFVGNLLVILVVAFHRRMHTITNFFLTNLAVADFCVGLFCVYQNLYNYLAESWSLGNFLCKMYHFVQSLSYTASIGILTVICLERYVAIVHPMWRKRVITIRRLRIVMALVWTVSAVYCSPRLFMFGTSAVPLRGKHFVICHMKRSLYNSKTYDIVNFVVCFLLPLTIISVIYTIICVRLWKSHIPKQTNEVRMRPLTESGSDTNAFLSATSSNICRSFSIGSIVGNSVTNKSCSDLSPSPEPTGRNLSVTGINRDLDRSRLDADHTAVVLHKGTRNMRYKTSTLILRKHQILQRNTNTTVLKARRRVIRLLVAVVFTFTLCNLPFHARKFWQYWSPNYHGGSSSAAVFTIVTTLVLYLNSGLNPILYAFLSKNFRHSIMDLLQCRPLRRMTFLRRTRKYRSDVSGYPNTNVRSQEI
ncbi:trissin receptor-like [Tachypleus tridentatus]|uniref:trissin receptor-like n=1 Tax=Tachypleus tridentatus TaxID=6853 RepID=UPI003FD0890A